MTADGLVTGRAPLTKQGYQWRRIDVGGDLSVETVATQLGCGVSAIVGLFPFIVDGSFVTVLASRRERVESRHLIPAVGGRILRRLQAEEVLLGFALGRPSTRVYLDERLLAQHELMLCISPPGGYVAAAPEALRGALRATVITLP